MKKRPSTGEIKYGPFWTKMPVLAILRMAVIIVVRKLQTIADMFVVVCSVRIHSMLVLPT